MGTSQLKTMPPRHSVSRLPVSPAHLSDASKDWFRSVVGEFIMSDTDLRVLTKACEQFDLAEEVRHALLKEGRWYEDARGIKRLHPAVKMEKDATRLACKLCRDLKLDVPPPRAAGRRPGSFPGATPTPQRRV